MTDQKKVIHVVFTPEQAELALKRRDAEIADLKRQLGDAYTELGRVVEENDVLKRQLIASREREATLVEVLKVVRKREANLANIIAFLLDDPDNNYGSVDTARAALRETSDESEATR